MPYFRVLLEGTGIDIPSENNDPPIVGFFTTRIVEASTGAEAESKVKEMILSDWSLGKYAEANIGRLPILSINSVEDSDFFESLRFKNKGYIFYPQQNDKAKNIDA